MLKETDDLLTQAEIPCENLSSTVMTDRDFIA